MRSVLADVFWQRMAQNDMTDFVEACFSRINGYRADRDIVAARVPLHIAAESGEGYLTYAKLFKSSVYVPLWQLYRRQFLAFCLRQGKDTSDGFKPDDSRFLVFILFGLACEDRYDDFFGFAAR